MSKQKPRHRPQGAPRAGGHSSKPNPPASAPQRHAPREAPRNSGKPNPLPTVQRDAPREAPRHGQELWIYGHHPVAAALANPLRKVLRLVATTEAAAKLTAERGVPERAVGQLRTQSRREIDQLVGEDAVHQGVAVLLRPLEQDLADVLAAITAENACIVVLDQVTDPHNVGAILRSAAAFGAAAVVAPDRHAPDESGAMAKSASGALDKIPYVKAGNLVRALEVIKEHRFWLVGLDTDTSKNLAEVDLKGRIALVLGAEGEGLRRLVRETCDHIAALPMAGDMESLNVSNAAAVALYERARQVPRGKP